MSALERITAYRKSFKAKNGRDPSAIEVARGLNLELARPGTIKKALQAERKYFARPKVSNYIGSNQSMDRCHSNCQKILKELMQGVTNNA